MAKSFGGLTWKQKNESQLQKFEGQANNKQHDRTVDDLPAEWENEDSDEMKIRKSEAAEFAGRMAYKRMRDCCDDDDDDSDNDSDEDNDGYYMRKQSKFLYTRDDIKYFFHDMQYNVMFDLGFRVTGFAIEDENNCYCPCSTQMHGWRKYFGHTGIAGKGNPAHCGNAHKFTPEGLVNHLFTLGTDTKSCVIHYGIFHYLHRVHGDKWGSVGHKALYKNVDINKYKLAVAAEKKSFRRDLEMICAERENDRKRIQKLENDTKIAHKDLENLGKVNKYLKKKIEELNQTKKELNLDANDTEDKQVQVNERELDEFRELKNSFFENLLTFDTQKLENYIPIPLKLNFRLQDFFEEFCLKGNKDETFMFRDLDDVRAKNSCRISCTENGVLGGFIRWR